MKVGGPLWIFLLWEGETKGGRVQEQVRPKTLKKNLAYPTSGMCGRGLRSSVVSEQGRFLTLFAVSAAPENVTGKTILKGSSFGKTTIIFVFTTYGPSPPFLIFRRSTLPLPPRSLTEAEGSQFEVSRPRRVSCNEKLN